MSSYLARLFEELFDCEKEHRCHVDGTWPCAEAPFGLDVFVFELVCELEHVLHNEYALEEIYLDCCDRLGIDPYVVEDDPVESFLNFMRSTGFDVIKYKEYHNE